MTEFKPTKPPLVCNYQAILEVKEELEGRNFKRAVCKDGYCVYRGNDGLRCAIGILLEGRIPEDSGAWKFPGGWRGLVLEEEEASKALSNVCMNVLTELQYIHDANANVTKQEKTESLQKLLNENPPIDV